MAAKTTHTKNKGLGNPALVAAASSPAGQKALGNSIEGTVDIAKKGADFLISAIKIIAVCGVLYYGYTLYRDRFQQLGKNTNLDPATINDAQAKARAEAIYQAMYGPGANFDQVAENLSGLNYNSWVLVYNAFGKRAGAYGSPMTLPEWINDQFSTSQVNDLRTIIANVF